MAAAFKQHIARLLEVDTICCLAGKSIIAHEKCHVLPAGWSGMLTNAVKGDIQLTLAAND